MVDDDSADRVNAASYSCRLTSAIPSQELQYAPVQRKHRPSLLEIFVSVAGLICSQRPRAISAERISGLASGAGFIELNGLSNRDDYKNASWDARRALELSPQHADAMRLLRVRRRALVARCARFVNKGNVEYTPSYAFLLHLQGI